jgi:hypothetical protein
MYLGMRFMGAQHLVKTINMLVFKLGDSFFAPWVQQKDIGIGFQSLLHWMDGRFKSNNHSGLLEEQQDTRNYWSSNCG